MSKHIKKLTNSIAPKVGSLIKQDGSATTIGQETSKELLTKHFPSHTPAEKTTYDGLKSITKKELEDKYENWIHLDILQLALNSFKAKKSPGPDGIRPIIFKYFPKNIQQTLLVIYKACIALHFTPTIWKDATVIFIPKPGKTDYGNAKAFRPISLSNYLLKVLEKLCSWRADQKLLKKPLHKTQHGFQRGKSTESALSYTVNEIEKYITKGHHCVGLFLDIQSAFDTIAPKYIKSRLLEHNLDEDLVNWYYDYLTHRNLITNITGHKDKVTIRVGFPQGGGC